VGTPAWAACDGGPARMFTPISGLEWVLRGADRLISQGRSCFSTQPASSLDPPASRNPPGPPPQLPEHQHCSLPLPAPAPAPPQDHRYGPPVPQAGRGLTAANPKRADDGGTQREGERVSRLPSLRFSHVTSPTTLHQTARLLHHPREALGDQLKGAFKVPSEKASAAGSFDGMPILLPGHFWRHEAEARLDLSDG
jgi:hypothetical protein